jgi:hypothetical protein
VEVPISMGSPNGDTPLPDGNLLVSEINASWVSQYTMTGTLAWTVHLPISYPSDPQQLGPDRYLIADYASPGGDPGVQPRRPDPLPLPIEDRELTVLASTAEPLIGQSTSQRSGPAPLPADSQQASRPPARPEGPFVP